jgi:hypothetical protein
MVIQRRMKPERRKAHITVEMIARKKRKRAITTPNAIREPERRDTWAESGV